MHTSNLNLYDYEWEIRDGILYSYNGEKKENVVVPDGVKRIVSNAFIDKIETLKLPKSLIEIGPGINAKKVHIFGNTKMDFAVLNVREKIEELVIYNNNNEETILNNLKQKVEKPYYLTKLKRITLRGKPIKEEYNEKFEILKEKLSKLDIDLILPKEFEIIDGMLIAYNGEDTNVIIPEGVRIIDANVFRRRNITNVILPESLETIRDNAFSDNNLEKIVIPSNVTFISYNAFLNNPNLKEIEMSVENNLSFSMPFQYLEHLILNSSNGNAIDIKNILKTNKGKLIKLKKLTIKDYNISYKNLKLIITKETTCNLDVTIENNNSITTYTFIDNNLNSITIEKDFNYIDFHALAETYKLYINNKIVKDFIDYIQSYNFTKSKNIGMIIIKGKNISLREKLALNKALGKIIFYSFEPSEEIEQEEERIEIDNSIEDEEISKLLTEINSILNTNTNTEDKNKILLQINNIINKYKQNLTKIKPKLFNEKSKFGEEELTPESLRLNLILELNNILNRLKNNNIYINLRKTITGFETLIQSKDLQIPEQIETLEDKVKYIISKSNLYEKHNFINELQTIFNEINRLISNSIITFKNDIELVSDAPIDKTLDKKVDTLYEEVKRISLIEETFNNDKSELAKDIKTIQTIISNFSIEHQNIFNEKLNSIINKYYQELISGQRKDLNETILEIRKIWHPLLEELNLKSFIYTKYKELIDELNSEKNDRVSTIEILINEINNLKDSSNLDNETKIEINNKLEKIINSWKNKLINNYEIEEKIDPLEDIFNNYNLTYIPKLKINNICIEIEIQITKELINLKNEILTYIQEKEKYEKLTKVMKNIKISG